MGIQFTEVMKKRSDSELLEIVTKLKNDYQPEAVEAAREEIKNRNLSQEQIDQAENEIKEKEKIEKDREGEPLETGQRIMFFIFFWGIVPWIMASTFKNKGYTKKYKDAWRFMKYGFLTYVGIIVIMILLVFTTT
jgi:uncharacterized membrane protein YdbT with pleckstrin-like domain